jgi:hypothetical protein
MGHEGQGRPLAASSQQLFDPDPVVATVPVSGTTGPASGRAGPAWWEARPFWGCSRCSGGRHQSCLCQPYRPRAHLRFSQGSNHDSENSKRGGTPFGFGRCLRSLKFDSGRRRIKPPPPVGAAFSVIASIRIGRSTPERRRGIVRNYLLRGCARLPKQLQPSSFAMRCTVPVPTRGAATGANLR